MESGPVGVLAAVHLAAFLPVFYTLSFFHLEIDPIKSVFSIFSCAFCECLTHLRSRKSLDARNRNAKWEGERRKLVSLVGEFLNLFRVEASVGVYRLLREKAGTHPD